MTSSYVTLASPVFDGTPVVRANPRKEVVVGGPYVGRFGTGAVLRADSVDEVVRQFGAQVYDLMRHDPAVACATGLLKAGILSDGLRLSAASVRSPGEVVADPARRAELQLASEIRDAAQRSLDRLDDPIDSTLEQMLEAFDYGCSLAEVVFEWAGTGPDAGKLVLKSIAVKPRTAWSFVVDPYFTVRAIRAWTGEGYADVERSHFALLAWKPRHRDPRGQSGLRPAYNPWNLKVQQYPELAEFLHRCAQQRLAVTASPDARDRVTYDAATGVAVETSATAEIGAAIESYYASGSGLVLPAGSGVQVIGPSGDGGAYHRAFDRWDVEIFRSILLSSRPVQEAQHGSKADSETGLDLLGMAFAQGRMPLARCIQDDILYPFVRLNWGKEIADRLTPKVSFGVPGHVKGDLLTAYATAFQRGMLLDGQLPQIWAELGLPDVSEAEIEEWRAARAALRNAALAQAGAVPQPTPAPTTGPRAAA